ncbi:hypothetical protein AN958_08073 [Leucoagaricus sp. SymC.cos]|nr:hypothetical protein AN958_08073 [Leucoagaricus sp. SymC.cos]
MAATSDTVPIETSHEDMIHDAQLDYYGKRLATCSSDRTVKVFDVVDGEPQRASGGQTLKGHTGPVWQVAWAHPAPHELGAILACASSDGKLSVLTFINDGQWDADIFNSHSIGCNAVSWAPAVLPGFLITPQQAPAALSQPSVAQFPSVKRFASAGCDNLVKIWGYREDSQSWVEEETLEGHTDWVRDVAWAPNIGLPRSYIATASQDKAVLVSSVSTSKPILRGRGME